MNHYLWHSEGARIFAIIANRSVAVMRHCGVCAACSGTMSVVRRCCVGCSARRPCHEQRKIQLDKLLDRFHCLYVVLRQATKSDINQFLGSVRSLACIALLSITLFCSGCGTIGNQEGSRTPNPVYGGTRADCYDIAHPGFWGVPGSVVGCFDLPFSFVGDTLLLPVDLVGLYQNSGAELKGWTFRPLPGWEMPPYGHNTNRLDNSVTDDYQDYIKRNAVFVLEPVTGYYEDGTGRHAIKFSGYRPGQDDIGHNYVLIYDKENKRVKTIKWGCIGLKSLTLKMDPNRSVAARSV